MPEMKQVPELRFPEFEGEWEDKRLDELLTFKNGINASKEDYGQGYKFINVLDIIQNDFITHDVILGSVQVSEEEFDKNIVEYGDILFQRSSETREEVGQANVYLDKEKSATFGGFVIRGKKNGEYDPAFLNFLLKSSKSRNEITTKSGGSTRYNVGQGTLSEVVIDICSLAEQQKIATFLTTIDQRLQLLRQKKTQLEAYKKGVMQKLFAQVVRFKDDNGQDYPDWEEKRLGEIVLDVTSGVSVNSTNKPVDSEDEFGILKTSCVSRGNFISSENKIIVPDEIDKARVNPKEGNIIVSRMNTPVLVGESGYVDRDYSNLFLPDRLWLLQINEIKNSSKFISILMSYDIVMNMFSSIATGTSGSMKNIAQPNFMNVILSLPSLPEQQKIATFLTSLDKGITKVAGQIESTSVYKKGLLQKMFI